MYCLESLFNSTSLIFIGIFTILIAIVINYFEGKLREHKHKMESIPVCKIPESYRK
jgi:hypothetical protein